MVSFSHSLSFFLSRSHSLSLFCLSPSHSLFVALSLSLFYFSLPLLSLTLSTVTHQDMHGGVVGAIAMMLRPKAKAPPRRAPSSHAPPARSCGPHI